MKKQVFLLIPVFLVFCNLSIFAKSGKQVTPTEKNNVPVWITDKGRNELFPSNLYVSGYAYDSNADQAKQKASATISEYIKSSITSSTDASFTSFQSGGTVKESTSIAQSTTISTDNNLFCLEYTVPYFDSQSGMYICVAYINRKTACNFIIPKLQNSSDDFKHRYQSALAQEDIFLKIIGIKNSQKCLQEFYEVYDFFKAVCLNVADKNSISDYDEIDKLFFKSKSLLVELKPLAKIFVTVNNDYQDQIKNAISTTLDETGFSVITGSVRPSTSVEIEYSLICEVSSEIEKAESVFVCYPAISVSVLKGDEVIFTYDKSFLKAAGFDKNSTLRKVYQVLNKDIKEKLF